MKYAERDVIARVAADGLVEDAVRELVECVKLPSGKLHDDVSVILGENVGMECPPRGGCQK